MKILAALLTLLAFVSCQPKAEDSSENKPASEPVPAPIDTSKPETLVGLTLEKAEAACDAAELKHRVIEINGEPQVATKDYRPERLNFAVKDGIIIAVTKG